MQTETHISLYKGEVQIIFKENKETGYHAYFVTDEKYGLKNKRAKGVTTIIDIKDKSTPLQIWATETMRDYLIDNFLAQEKPITYDDLLLAAKEYKNKKEKAADIGSQIHNWIERFVRHTLREKDFQDEPAIPEDKAIRIGISAFLDWVNEHKVEFLSAERIVYSREHQIIGTMDIEAIVDGVYGLIDIKTGNGIYNSVKMQTGIYCKADHEEKEYSNPKKFKKYQTRWAIRLSKETEEEYIERMKRKLKTEWPKYQIFEAREFPEVEGDNIETDCIAFLHAKGLKEWDDKTDFYKLSLVNKQKDE